MLGFAFTFNLKFAFSSRKSQNSEGLRRKSKKQADYFSITELNVYCIVYISLQYRR